MRSAFDRADVQNEFLRYFFFDGTFFPSRRASERPMAMACFGFVTFLPLRPDFSLPLFIACISRFTSLPAEGEYLRLDDFLELDLRELDFFADELRVFFFALLLRVLFFVRVELPLRDFVPRDDEVLVLPLDLFFAAFFVAITILLGGQMASSLEQVVSGIRCKVALQCTNERTSRYTTRRIPGMRTSGSAMSHVAMHASKPVVTNLRIAGATHG